MAGWPHDEEQDALTPAEKQLHRHLLADGMAWRRRAEPSLPGLGVFVARAQQRLAQERAHAMQSVGATAPRSLDQQDTHETHDTKTLTENIDLSRAGPPANRQAATQRAPYPKGSSRMSSTPPLVTPHPPRRRFAGIAAGGAALIVVALFATILTHAFGARTNGPLDKGHNSGQTPQSAGTATPTPGVSYSGPFLQPAIAPSNPQIVYLVDANGNIQRSANGGKTYTRVTPPQVSFQSPQYFVMVSPLDASHIVATATGSGTPGTPDCPVASNGQSAGRAARFTSLSGNPPCSESFFSANSGQTWSALTLPFSGAIASTMSLHSIGAQVNIPTTTLFAQGSRLYATGGASAGNGIIFGAAGAHLLVSVDGGASWQAADSGIAGTICDVAAAPTGATLYAITASGGCNNESQSALVLWRSNDAGASWGQVNALPTPNDEGMVVTADGSLYINMPNTSASQPGQISVDPSPDALLVSSNGGQSLTRAPVTDAPAKAAFVGPLGVLSDGSALMATFHANGKVFTSTFYTWRAGQSSWRQIGRAMNGEITDVVVVAQGARDTLYVAVSSGKISHFTV